MANRQTSSFCHAAVFAPAGGRCPPAPSRSLMCRGREQRQRGRATARMPRRVLIPDLGADRVYAYDTDGMGPSGWGGYAPLAFFTVNRLCIALLSGDAGRLTRQNGGFRPGQRRPARWCRRRARTLARRRSPPARARAPSPLTPRARSGATSSPRSTRPSSRCASPGRVCHEVQISTESAQRHIRS